MPALPRRLFDLLSAPRPRRKRWMPCLASAPAAIERLEPRAMLTPGAVMWNTSHDLELNDDDRFKAVAVQPDGKIVAVGEAFVVSDDDFLIARFTAGGLLDRSFGGGGFTRVDFLGGRNDSAEAVVIQADGKIVVGGTTRDTNGKDSFGLARFNADGTLDTSYGSSGRVIEDNPSGEMDLEGLARTADGGVIAAGRKSDTGGSSYGTVYKFNSAGVKDGTFNGAGFRNVTSVHLINDVAIDALGRVVVVDGDGRVARLTSTGALDGGFGSGGVVQIGFDIGGGPVGEGVAVMPDGRIVVAGFTDTGVIVVPGVARLKADGTYDNTFDANGRYSFSPTPNAGAQLADIAVLPNGGVVVGGEDFSATDVFVAVLTPDGVLDGTFASGGIARANFGGSDVGNALAVTASGHYVLAGSVRIGDGDLQSGIAQFEGRFPRRDDLAGWTNAGQWWVASSNGTAFQNRFFGSWDPGLGWKIVAAGDVTGDGKSDVLGRDGMGRWWVGVNTGTGFATSLWGRWTESAGWRDERFADFTGDGKIDVAGRTAGGQWWVMTSLGTRFAAATAFAVWAPSAGWRDVLAADFTGDGKTDLAGRTSGGQWWVSRYLVASNSFTTNAWAAWTESVGWRDVRAGDFNGDGWADIAGRTNGGQWWVSVSGGLSFTSTSLWVTWTESAGWRDILVGDFNRDGRADIAGRTAAGQWWVAVANSAGTAFTNRLLDTWSPSAGWRDVTVGDFDGDGFSDIAGRTSGGQWWVSRVVAESVSLWATWTESAGWRTFRGEFTPTLT